MIYQNIISVEFFFIVLNEIIYAVSRDMQFVRTLQVIIDQILGHACKTA